MRLITRTSSAAVVLAVVASLGLTACGDKDSSSSDGASSTGTKDTSATSTGSGDALTKATFFQRITDAQAKAGTSHVSLKIKAAGQDVTAEGDVKVGKTVKDTAMTMSMDIGAGGLDGLKMVLVDNVFYLDFGSITDNKYAKIDLADDSNAFAKPFGSITDQLDPSKQLDQFKTAVTTFKKAGSPEKIDGVEAQPYDVVVDTSKISSFSDLPAGATSSIRKTLTYTMYVDSDDLLRRVSADVAGSSVIADYSKWGEPVDVKAPAAKDITDLDLSKLGAASS